VLATGWYPSPYDTLPIRAALLSQAYVTDDPIHDLEIVNKKYADALALGSLGIKGANLICAGPVSGAPAFATFRSLVGADFPVDLSIDTLSITTLLVDTLSVTTLSVTTLSAGTFLALTAAINALSIDSLSISGLTASRYIRTDASKNLVSDSPDKWVDAQDYATLAAANTAAYNAGKLLIISKNYTLVANTTLTASVMRIPGGSFTKASTHTLTISGSFENPSNGKCFFGFDAGDVTFAGSTIREVYPKWWVTNTTPGTTDASVALKSAVASVTGIPIIISEIYLATECIYLKHETHLKFSKGAYILGKHTGPAIISLKGATQCVLENAYVYGSATTSPKTGIALGRSVPYSGQENTLYRPNVEGHFSVAGYYTIAAEILIMYSPRTNILGGGAKYCFYSADTDELSIDSFVAGSNTVINIYSPDFVNEQTDLANAAGIYIGSEDGNTGAHLFKGGWIGAKSGVYVQINVNHNDPYPLTFEDIHGEGLTGTGPGVYLSTTSGIDVNAYNISFMRVGLHGPTNVFVTSDNYIVLRQSILDNIWPGGTISLYKAMAVDFGKSLPIITITGTIYEPIRQYNIAGNAEIQLTDDSATPSIKDGNIFYSYNTNPTTITNFTGGYAGKIIYIIFYNTNTTINTTTDIKLSAVFNSANTNTLTLMHNGSRWYEIARQQLP